MRRLPKPNLYELRRWSHASNVARRDHWNASGVRPGARGGKVCKPIVCEETGQTWATVNQLREHVRCRLPKLRAALERGEAIDGFHYRRSA
jgi:hypothetical protein